VLIEPALGLVFLRLRADALGLGTAVREPVGGGRLLGLLPPGLLALRAKIDDVAHPQLGSNRMRCQGTIQVRFIWNNYADTAALDHATDKPPLRLKDTRYRSMA
jgi:hypothetical protein